MPTVRRSIPTNYLSNAIKSWRLATNHSSILRTLVIFNMDPIHPHYNLESQFLQDLFINSPSSRSKLPSWLRLYQRQTPLRSPRKLTLQDSAARVAWRSKEALDYAEVLQRCASLASSDMQYIIIVQDDILFRPSIRNVIHWSHQHIRPQVDKHDPQRHRLRRVCGASLFDLPPNNPNRLPDAHVLQTSNMVARVWPINYVTALHKYILHNFDEAPVDWLADRKCSGQKRSVLVMEPQPVRHRGAVSSFAENNRFDSLT